MIVEQIDGVKFRLVRCPKHWPVVNEEIMPKGETAFEKYQRLLQYFDTPDEVRKFQERDCRFVLREFSPNCCKGHNRAGLCRPHGAAHH
jgi:hypothetical protein